MDVTSDISGDSAVGCLVLYREEADVRVEAMSNVSVSEAVGFSVLYNDEATVTADVEETTV